MTDSNAAETDADNQVAPEPDAEIASTPRKHALDTIDALLGTTSDPETASELKKVRARVKEVDRNRENAVNRLQALHEAAGYFLRGLRDRQERKCFFCGNAAVQHEPWCIAWAIIDWRDGNHNRGAKKAGKMTFEKENRPVDNVAAATPYNKRWDDNADTNRAAYTDPLV